MAWGPIVCCLVFVLGGTYRVAAQWTVADSSGTQAIHEVGAYGANGFIGISGELYLSTDAGGSWVTQAPTINGFPLFGVWRDAYFPTTTNGYVVGAFDANNQYAIVHSVDGGATWQMVHFSNAGNWPRRYNGVHFPTATMGYAVGTNGRISKTTNGGSSWSDITSPVASEITSTYFSTATTGVIAGNDFVRSTTDGGATWPGTLAVTGRHVVAGTGANAVACGPSQVHISTDGGATWTTRPAPFTSPKGLHVFNPSEFVVIDDGQDKAYITRTGGLYWEVATLPVQGSLEDIHFISPVEGCIVGSVGSRSLILATSTGLGQGVPFATIGSSATPACGSTAYALQAMGVDPSWSLVWYRDGLAVGTGATLNAVFQASTSSTGIELHISNGAHTAIVPWTHVVQVDQPFTVEAGDNVFICSGGSTALSVIIPPGASVLWQPPDGLSNATSATPIVSGLTGPITYTVTVTNGLCSAMDQVTVDVAPVIPEADWDSLHTGWSRETYQFLDSYNGFASVARRTMWRTRDGGLTWDSLHVNVTSSGSQVKLAMADICNGYINEAYALYHTTDGWETYTSISNTILGIGSSSRYKHAYPKNRDTVFVRCYPNSAGSDMIIRTLDAGNSWTTVATGLRDILDIVFLQNNVMLAGGGGVGGVDGVLYRSDDAGTTWYEIPTPSAMGRISDLEVTSNNVVYAVYNNNLWRSFDQGTAWEHLFAGTGPVSRSSGWVSFQGPDTGYASLDGSLYETVTGGDCWQMMAPNVPTYIGSVRNAGGQWFLQADELGPEPTLFRRDPPLPGLLFTMCCDTICAGNIQIVANNSLGYDSFEWWVDGTFLSNDVQPTMPPLTPGAHTITLIGHQGGTTDTITRPLYVEAFDVTPVLSLPEAPCWLSDTVLIVASSPVPVLSYRWYRVTPTDTLFIPGGGPVLSVVAKSSPNTYLAVPVSRFGCLGNFSGPVTVSASDAIPVVTQPVGPASVCTWGNSITTLYTASQTNGTDVTDYVWTIVPDTAATLIPAGASCQVSWNPYHTGNASLRCAGVDTCGVGPSSNRNIHVDPGNSIVVQPQDIVVNVGDSFTLTVVTASPLPSSGSWYQNGALVYPNVYTITIPAATFAMAGEYYWSGLVSGTCGLLTTDTINVTVLGPTGILAQEGTGQGLVAYPNPFETGFTVILPKLNEAAQLVLMDATGRVLMNRLLAPGEARPQDLELPDLRAGSYYLWLRSPSVTARTIILKIP